MLCAHLMNSASAGSAKVRSSPPNGESSSRRSSTVSGARLAITVIHGLAKSSAAEAARRNSGFEASPKPSPAARPDRSSSTVRTRPSVVPGGTVDRTTTVWCASVVASARPTAAVPAVNADRS
ncbi:hypothetical protein BJF90_11040 [Pseudonocardia sp. CNS-004]|nr:hypothetical protein BJF90_11040 [Pseudonocardia sp. CNS-004]